MCTYSEAGNSSKMRKTHRSICHKGIQKCTSLDRNGVQMKDGPDRMTRNLKKQVMNLNQLMKSCDFQICILLAFIPCKFDCNFIQSYVPCISCGNLL